MLTYSPYDGRLYNQIAIDHSQAMVGAVPILVLDMYEHAYHLEFGANAAAPTSTSSCASLTGRSLPSD